MSKSSCRIAMLGTPILLIALGSGCSQHAADQGSPETQAPTSQVSQQGADTQIEYEVITANEMLIRAASLCRLVAGYTGGAGLYRVAEMIGVTEDVGARTYINLELLEAWSPNAPGNPVARIHGGPGRDGVTVGFPVDLRKGEVVGVLLIEPIASEDPTRDSKGFYGLYQPGIFHDVGDGFTNGQLFTQRRVSAAELGAFIAAAVAKAGSPDCRDVLPDPPEYPDGTGEDVIGPEVQGEPVNPEDLDKL